MTTSAWARMGLVLRAQGQRPWMISHSQMPHAEVVEGSVMRVYFTSRDAENRSHIGWFVMDLERPGKVLDLAVEPLMAPGPVGGFDDVGVMTSWMVREAGRRRFYTIGWNIPTSVPMHVSIGLAEGPADGPPVIDRRLPGPVLERNPADPFYVSTPCVLRDGERWRMWYMSGLDWAWRDGKPLSRYDVRHATSADGVAWTPDREVCLPLVHPGEMAIARPQVVRDADAWRMWHCYRGETFPYRIGYAQSEDGRTWRRLDDDPLTLAPAGGDAFDSEMTCYPYVFDHGGERWMLYCGDGFGQGGIGLAQLRRDRTQ
ncbi:MAG: hypothetical protein ACXWKR_09670 [Phenylobacterium sp.]